MKTKQISLFAGMFLFIQAIFAQIPAGYYNTATGTGAALKTQLYNIIKGHTDKGYSGLYACYITTDNLPGNKVFDMYSVRADSTAAYWFTNSASSADQCGNYAAESDCYNREHSFCDSWLGEASPQRSDLFHVYPTDGYVNNRRSSYPHGKVGSPSWTSTNGSKLGTSDASTGYTGTVFEPIDAFKGDFARSYFYIATRYENLIAGWVNNGSADQILAGNAYPAYQIWFLNLMIQWHNQDPVSQKEILRNEAVYGYQHNRNPYIDHPEWVNTVWGTGTTVSQGQEIPLVSYYPNPVENKLTIDLSTTTVLPELIWISDITGKILIQTKPIESRMDIDMTSFRRGVYFLNISSKQSKTTYKLVH